MLNLFFFLLLYSNLNAYVIEGFERGLSKFYPFVSILTPINADFQSQPNSTNFTGNEWKLTMIFYKYSEWLKIHWHQIRRIWILREKIRLLISYYP